MRQITTAKVVRVCFLSDGCHPSLWRTESSPPPLTSGKQEHVNKHIHMVALLSLFTSAKEYVQSMTVIIETQWFNPLTPLLPSVQVIWSCTVGNRHSGRTALPRSVQWAGAPLCHGGRAAGETTELSWHAVRHQHTYNQQISHISIDKPMSSCLPCFPLLCWLQFIHTNNKVKQHFCPSACSHWDFHTTVLIAFKARLFGIVCFTMCLFLIWNSPSINPHQKSCERGRQTNHTTLRKNQMVKSWGEQMWWLRVCCGNNDDAFQKQIFIDETVL